MTVTIMKPAGGEVWNNTQKIYWKSNAHGMANLELFKNNEPIGMIAEHISLDDDIGNLDWRVGSYGKSQGPDWPQPYADPGTGYKIRITSGGQTLAESPSFTIAYLALEFLSGSGLFSDPYLRWAGCKYYAKLYSAYTSGYIEMALYHPDLREPIKLDAIKTDGAPVKKSYTLPQSVLPLKGYKIILKDLLHEECKSETTEITIDKLEISAPNKKSELFFTGSIKIVWKSNFRKVRRVNLELFNKDKVSIGKKENIYCDGQSYTWQVAAPIDKGYTIKVTPLDAAPNPGPDDVCVLSAISEPFEIREVKLNVISPKAKVELFIDEPIEISWQQSIPTPKIRVELLDGSDPIRVIREATHGYAATRIYWTPDSDLKPGRNFRIRVTALDFQNLVAVSDAFTIAPREVDLTFDSKISRVIHDWSTVYSIEEDDSWIYQDFPDYGDVSNYILMASGNTFVVGYDNYYREEWDLVSWSSFYFGEIIRGFLFINSDPISEWISSHIRVTDVYLKIRARQTTRGEGTLASNDGSAIKELHVLSEPWSGGFSTSHAKWMDVPDISHIPGQGKVLDITYVVISPFSGEPDINNGIMFIGPNETMLHDPESNHNNNKFMTSYVVERIWARYGRK